MLEDSPWSGIRKLCGKIRFKPAIHHLFTKIMVLIVPLGSIESEHFRREWRQGWS
jgi:hypothetical protein